MAKYLRKKKKKPVALIIVIVLVVILLAALVLFVMPQLLYRLSGGSEESEPVQTDPYYVQETATPETTEAAEAGRVFPLALEDGRLEIDSLFPFSGINPDCGNQEGTDIAAIQLKNVSGSYLTEAKITLTLADGGQVNFAVMDLAAGKSVMAFSTENLSIPAGAVCVDAECSAVFDDTAVTMPEEVSVSVSGVTITLTNTSDENLSQVVVYCRSALGEDPFGGITYQYVVTGLPAGESTTVEASDCIMGMAEVVRVAINKE